MRDECLSSLINYGKVSKIISLLRTCIGLAADSLKLTWECDARVSERARPVKRTKQKRIQKRTIPGGILGSHIDH